MVSKHAIWEDFLSRGNSLVGDVSSATGKNAVVTAGSNNSVQIGKNVKFIDVRIEMPHGGATLIIGDNVRVRGIIQIAANSTVTIGTNSFFNRKCHLSAWEGASILIGKDCLLSDVRIRTSDMHSVIDIASGARINAARDTVIEDRVWLGEGVTLYKGVTVGSGSIVGGGSVVTQPVSQSVLVAGNPARVIRTDVTWQRDLIKLEPKRAKKTGDIIKAPTKTELSDLIADKKYSNVIFRINEYLKVTGIAFVDIETYAQYYFARAQHELGNLESAISSLEIVVRRNPSHKVAAELLNRLTDQAKSVAQGR